MIIVDGNNFLHPIYWILRQSDRETVLRGYLDRVRKLKIKFGDPKFYLVFDSQELQQPLLFPKNREPVDIYLKEVVDLFSLEFQVLRNPGMEADRLIAHLALSKSSPVKIVSSDKDFYQLLTEYPRLTLYDHLKKKEITPKEVESKLGIPPEKFVFYLSLVGDSADGIPGLTSCGPKTALSVFCRNYLSLEDAYDKISSKSTVLSKIEHSFLQNYELLQKCQQAIRLDVIEDLKIKVIKPSRNRREICDSYQLDYDKIFHKKF